MGTGYLPERVGQSAVKKSLLSVHGLLIKINKGVSISWLIAFAILGVANDSNQYHFRGAWLYWIPQTGYD